MELQSFKGIYQDNQALAGNPKNLTDSYLKKPLQVMHGCEIFFEIHAQNFGIGILNFFR